MHYLLQKNPPTRTYEKTLRERLWSFYGTLCYAWLNKFIKRCAFTHKLVWWFEPVKYEWQGDCEWFGKHYIAPTFHRYPFALLFQGMGQWYQDNAYLMLNKSYKDKRKWYTPLLFYPCYFVVTMVRKEFVCCGYNGTVSDYIDYPEYYEHVDGGYESTPDGAEGWQVGWVYCPRCRSPNPMNEV